MSKIVGIRLSEPFRTLLQSGGEMSAIARALMLIGAHAAGYDLTPLRGDVAVLLNEALPAALDTRLREVLSEVLNTPLNTSFNRTFNTLLNTERANVIGVPRLIPAAPDETLPVPTIADLGLPPEEDTEDADPLGSFGFDV